MEIFNTIYEVMTTPNLELCNLIVAPFGIIEIIVNMLLFTTLLNLKANQKSKIIYVVVLSAWTMLSNYLLPKPFGLYLNILICPIAIHLVFKGGILKSIVATILPLLFSAVAETIIIKIYYMLFSIPYESIVAIPIHRILLISLIYLSVFILYLLAKKFNWSLTFKNIKITSNSTRVLYMIMFLLGIIAVATQAYLIVFYMAVLPLPIVILNIISLIAYFVISVYSLFKSYKLETTSQDLEQTQLYNKTLELLHDKLRAFKHDFGNIMQSLAGYVDAGDMEGLRKHFYDLNTECIETSNLSALNPTSVNNPAIYSILAAKYYEADNHEVKINFEIFLDLNTLKMKTYEFTRILGILLDNAIEAAKDSDEKVINLVIRKDFNAKRQLLVIENSYSNKDIDTEKIFEKGYTTKENNSGVGLWEVRQILHKNHNLNLFTSKDDKLFTQQLEIY